MATDPANDIKLQKERAAQLNKINMLGQEFNSIMKDASINMKQQLKDAGATTAEIQDMNKGFGTFNTLARSAAKLSKADLSNRRTRNKLQSQANKAADEAVQIAAKIQKYADTAKKLEDKAAAASGEKKAALEAQAKKNRELVTSGQRQLDIADDLQKQMQGMLDLSTKITKAGRFFSFFSDLVGDVPVLGTVFNNLTKAAELFDSSMAAGESTIKATLRGLGEFVKLGAKALAAFAVSSAIKGMNILDQAVVSINRNLVMAGKSASISLGNIRAAAARTGMTLEKLLPINQALNETFGTSAVFSKDTLTAQSLLVNKLGLSAEEGAKLFKETAGSKENVGEFVRSAADLVTNFNKTNDSVISIKTILQDVSHASATTSINTAKFPGGIRTAALEARRLGTSLEKTNSLMEGFLDFESSIQAEMDAELFTGRQLNLERVRAAALSGDQAELAKQIRLEAGSFSDFQNLNLLQQQKLAAAFNMSADDLGTMLKNQKAMKEASKENAKEGGEQAKSGEELINKLQSQVTLGEGFASAMERIQLAFGNIITKFAPEIINFLSFAASKTEQMVGYLSSEAGQASLEKIKSGIQSVGTFLKDDVIPALEKTFKWLGENTMGAENWKIVLSAIAGFKFLGLISGLSTIFKTVKSIGNLFGLKSAIGQAFTKDGLFGSGGRIAQAFKPGGTIMSGISNFSKTIGSTFKGLPGMDKLGGMFSGAKNFVSEGFKKLNPMEAIKTALGKAGGIGKVLGKIAKFPLLATALEGAFAYNDIQGLLNSGLTGKELDAAIGERAYGAIGTVLGSLGGSALGSIFPGAGTMIGGILGAMGGPSVARGIASMADPDYSKFGGVVSELPFFKDGIEVEDFVIKPMAADTITMAGGTKLGGNVESLLEELISLTKEGKIIKMDTATVGRSLQLNASKMSY